MQGVPTFTLIDRLSIWLGHYSLRKRVRVLMASVNIFSALVVSSSVVFFVHRSEQNVWVARQEEASQNGPSQVHAYLEQVIANLVSNAVKFTEHGWVRVHVMCGEDHHWIIQVQDTGIGIPAHAQPPIFEPFRQVDESIKRKYGGFGLGLSIVKHLTVLMDGQIAVQSTESIGSCFTVTLPYCLDGQIRN